jgi:hypothetical protein
MKGTCIRCCINDKPCPRNFEPYFGAFCPSLTPPPLSADDKTMSSSTPQKQLRNNGFSVAASLSPARTEMHRFESVPLSPNKSLPQLESGADSDVFTNGNNTHVRIRPLSLASTLEHQEDDDEDGGKQSGICSKPRLIYWAEQLFAWVMLALAIVSGSAIGASKHQTRYVCLPMTLIVACRASF